MANHHLPQKAIFNLFRRANRPHHQWASNHHHQKAMIRPHGHLHRRASPQVPHLWETQQAKWALSRDNSEPQAMRGIPLLNSFMPLYPESRHSPDALITRCVRSQGLLLLGALHRTSCTPSLSSMGWQRECGLSAGAKVTLPSEAVFTLSTDLT